MILTRAEHIGHIARLRPILVSLASICDEDGDRELSAAVSDIASKLDSGVMSIAVAGEFNRGKTTLINAMIGCALLPCSVIANTAVPWRVRYLAEPAFRVIFSDGRPDLACRAVLDGKECRPENIDILEYSLKPGSAGSDDLLRAPGGVSLIETGAPSEFLAGGIELFDTPGINDISGYGSGAAMEALRSADAVILVVDSRQPLNASEISFLKELAGAERPGGIFIALNKTDALDPEEVSSSMAYCEKTLARCGVVSTVFAVSAKLGLSGGKTAFGVDRLRTALLDRFACERSSLALASSAVRARTVAGLMLASVSNSRHDRGLMADHRAAAAQELLRLSSMSSSAHSEAVETVNSAFDRLASRIDAEASKRLGSAATAIEERAASGIGFEELSSAVNAVIRIENGRYVSSSMSAIEECRNSAVSSATKIFSGYFGSVPDALRDAPAARDDRSRITLSRNAVEVVASKDLGAIDMTVQLFSIAFGANPFLAALAVIGGGMAVSAIRRDHMRSELIEKARRALDEVFSRSRSELMSMLAVRRSDCLATVGQGFSTYRLALERSLGAIAAEVRVSSKLEGPALSALAAREARLASIVSDLDAIVASVAPERS